MSKNAYLYMLAVEPVKVGEVYQSLRLHCTLMLWFYPKGSVQDLFGVTHHVFSGHGAIEIVSDSPKWFGVNNDVPVHTVKENTKLRELHNKLYQALNDLGVRHSMPDFSGRGFSPHVTSKGERSFPPGSRFLAHYVYLVETIGVDPMAKERRIIEQIPLL